jgi:hypothetical protein
MTKQPYFVNTSDKQMEIFNSLGGGMVTQLHQSKMKDDQLRLIENGDIIAGGVITNRGGYKRTNKPSTAISGLTQGVFFYDDNTLNGQTIIAINGKLYKVSGNTYTNLPITNLTGGFQTTRLIEAVQYRTLMYFATGSGLVKYDGTTATLVDAYTPTGLEALYVGLNALAVDPESYIADNTAGAADLILGFKCDSRYGLVNQYTDITAYVEKISSHTLEYRWSSKFTSEPTSKYHVWQDWSTNKVYHHKYTHKNDYSIKCEIRKQGTTAVLDEHVLSKFRVLSSPDPKPAPTINFADISTCTRILLHYNRLVMYGDTNNPDHLYISHLNNFAYFPRNNILRVFDSARGKLKACVQYRNFMLCFTDNSIQMLSGSSPTDFSLSPVHTTIGTNRSHSVAVIKNYVAFVGSDNAVYIIKQFNYSTTDKLNIERIDLPIQDDITNNISQSSSVMTTVYNNQLYIYIQNLNDCFVYRYYYELDVWVRDWNAVMQFANMRALNNVLYFTSSSGGQIFQLTKGYFFDDDATKSYRFTLALVSKDYDYGMPYHKKKLKQFQVLCSMQTSTRILTTLYSDDGVLLAANMGTTAKDASNDSQKIIMAGNGRFRYIKADMRIGVLADFTILGFGFVFKYGAPK